MPTPEEKELACVICDLTNSCETKQNIENDVVICAHHLKVARRVKAWLESSGFMEKWAREHGWVKVDVNRPKIVCLCGSTRFKQEFIDANFMETMQGNIVLSVGWFSHSDKAVYYPTPEEKLTLDELHKRKIDLADEIYVINVGGYIGESTRSEINYAIAHGKPVEYLEPLERQLQEKER